MYRIEDNFGTSVIEFTINRTDSLMNDSYSAELVIHYSHGRRRGNLTGKISEGFEPC